MPGGDQLQEGIYHAPGQRPGANFSILFLRVRQGHQVETTFQHLSGLWDLLQGLRNGKSPSLPGVILPSSGLTVLIGYGYNIFGLDGVKKERPAALQNEFRFLSPNAGGGGEFLPGSGLRYADDVTTNLATEDIVLQFIGDTQLAVNRPIVEIQSYLRSLSDPALEIASAYHGFNREDGRSWIGFHDGISNIPSRSRWRAMVIKVSGWTKGGTYLAFVRVGVDLAGWQRISLRDQELAVGRAKISGCPFTGVAATGELTPAAGCPVAPGQTILDPGHEGFIEPTAPQFGDTTIIKSHVQRANNAHSSDWSSKSSLRVYRQGYEFLETGSTPSNIRAGLNFVSFQDHPERLIRMLSQDAWLGATNFGGEVNSQNPIPELRSLLSVRAAAVFLVPPVISQGDLPGMPLFVE